MSLRFEWDPKKAAANRAKHGVTFEEAASVFGDPLGRIVDDPRHSFDEQRHLVLRFSERQRLLAVMFTERQEATIRLISARTATRQERRNYEERNG